MNADNEGLTSLGQIPPSASFDVDEPNLSKCHDNKSLEKAAFLKS